MPRNTPAQHAAASDESIYGERDFRVPEEQQRRVHNALCDRMAQGELTGKALAAVGLSRRRLAQWHRESETLTREYLQARVLQAACLAERVVETAEKPVASIWDAKQQDTHVRALQWAAAKLDPSRWADKVEIEHTSTKVVRHVVMMPARQGPPPAIVGGRQLESIGDGEVITPALTPGGPAPGAATEPSEPTA